MKSSLRNKSVFICTRRESYIVRGVRVRERVLSCIFDRFFSLRFDVLFSILPLVSIAQIIPWVNHVLDSVKFKGKRVNDVNNNLRFIIIICESSNNNDRWWSCEINKFINLWHSFYKKKSGKNERWYSYMYLMWEIEKNGFWPRHTQTKDENKWSSVKIYYYKLLFLLYEIILKWSGAWISCIH